MISDQIRDPCVQAATDIAFIARATAPRSTDPDADHFANHFKVVSKPAPVFVTPGGFRQGARVENDSDHAVQVEFGTSKTEAHRTLGRAGAQIGRLDVGIRGRGA